MSPLAIRFDRAGLSLPKLGLWLDPRAPQSGPVKSFISHAHSDHTGLHREVILTEGTARLMRARLKGEWIERILPFSQPAEFEGPESPYSMTLLPAGHIFGSAMALIQAGNSSLLYTGDFKLRPSRSAELCQPRPADILIMETTYGRPKFQFPPASEVLPGVIRFCREALDHDETPVLLGYSLGKCQELLCCLAGAGLSICLQKNIAQMTRVYEELGHSFPDCEPYETGPLSGKVLLCPPRAHLSKILEAVGPARTAILTGWAVDPNCRHRWRADAAFPLSDHADFPELIELVKQVNPKKIYTLHGFAADFAQTLRGIGFNAQALTEQEQLELGLPGGKLSAKPSSLKNRDRVPDEPGGELAPAGEEPPASSFHHFALTCSAIGATSKKLEKVKLLARFLEQLQPKFLRPIATWFTGKPFPAPDNKALQLGWAIVRDALCAAGEIDQAEFGRIYLKHSDLGETALEILEKNSPRPPSLSLEAVEALFLQLHAVRGPLAKLPLLTGALRQAGPLEGKFLVKILTGDLRIGLKEGLVEEAVAQAFDAPLEEVKNACLLLGAIGETARLAQAQDLASAGLVLFRPIKYMLASPEKTARDIWNRARQWREPELSGATELPLLPPAEPARPRAAGASDRVEPSPAAGSALWIEDKYDGIRAQVHKAGSKVALYSRDLKEITAAFLELTDSILSLPLDFVLDGEIIGFRDGRILPFAELQKRLGRRDGDLFLSGDIPVAFIAFDLLWFNGETLLKKPLAARRRLLETIARPGNFLLSQITPGQSPAEIERAFEEARARGNEGLLIKDPSSHYNPGRRGLAWLKLKKALATLDCVVIGAEFGHGKRKAVLSDYTFAVRDESSGQLKTIGKAFTGLTDVEIIQLTRHFHKTVVRKHGRYFEVKPDTVLEIAFDALQKSERHTSGLAMRFPRIVRIRQDKSPADIDTLETARKLLRRS